MTSRPPVYVVDDDPVVLNSVKAILESRGFLVSPYPSAEAFLREADLNSIGCLVTDLNMPGVDGIELQRRINQSQTTLSVIFVTGFASVGTTVKIMESGAVTLLEKPYEPDRLIRAIDTAIARNSLAYSEQLKQRTARALIAQLNDEELMVLDYASAGLTNKAIERKLCLSGRTVDRRKQSGLNKLRVQSVADFALLRARCK